MKNLCLHRQILSKLFFRLFGRFLTKIDIRNQLEDFQLMLLLSYGAETAPRNYDVVVTLTSAFMGWWRGLRKQGLVHGYTSCVKGLNYDLTGCSPAARD